MLKNKAMLELELCGKKQHIQTNEIKIRELDIYFHQFDPCCDIVVRGAEVELKFKLKNKSDMDLHNLEFSNFLGRNEYVEGSFKVCGEHKKPKLFGDKVIYRIHCLHPGDEMEITFKIKIA